MYTFYYYNKYFSLMMTFSRSKHVTLNDTYFNVWTSFYIVIRDAIKCKNYYTRK